MDFRIDYKAFSLKSNYFDNQSIIHGINHTYRVMYHVLQIATVLKLKREGVVAFCAAYIHDLARLNDGYCTQHGAWASERKLSLYKDLFLRTGLADSDLGEIEIAVTNHSLTKELDKNDNAYLVTALLKDADALDRIRLGDENLDLGFLRFAESKMMVSRSKEIFFATDKMSFRNFAEILEFIESI
ncbi:MAG: hypothetical protein DRJ05_06135 [Bacteroidetes bacterium]|nr:MAG: hypothetical protein DRJ05_06135 [Bacteroidota bacterium]